MTPNDIISLTAFLSALEKLDEPLPENIQQQLQKIRQSINQENISYDLDNIAQSYPPLDNWYLAEKGILKQGMMERSKDLLPEPLPIENTKELTNAAINTFSQADSSVAAKTEESKNILRRLRNLIMGKQA